jgi:DNA mismatch repair protein MutS
METAELKLTPMIQQYKKIKRGIPQDAILMFRLGDFYEMFFEDAKIASKVLNITLTRRSKDEGRDYPMCGIPFHAADSYIGKLIKAGHKVAVCDQVEDPKLAKGIVKREVTKLITPGTVLDAQLLDEKKNNFIVAINRIGKLFGIAYLDFSTGEFKVTEIGNDADFLSELSRIGPVECILPKNLKDFLDKNCSNENILKNYYDDWVFDYDNGYNLIKDHFKTHSLDGFGCQGLVPAITAAGALFQYLKENLHNSLSHIQKISLYSINDYMVLDTATIRNLELIEPIHSGPKNTTLFGVLDCTITSMGGRLLQKWIKQPLLNVNQINERQESVKYFYQNKITREKIIDLFKAIPDIERIIGRVESGFANARDLVALKQALSLVPEIKVQLNSSNNALLKSLYNDLQEVPELVDALEKAFYPDPPLSLREGGFIRDGFNAELDELRNISTQAKDWLTQFQAREASSTGIKSLKVRYNKVFGYYIEISNSNRDAVPSNYERKQTLVNAERYITPDLKEYETKILNAKDQIGDIEYKLFIEIKDSVRKYTEKIQKTAQSIAVIDVLISFSEVSLKNSYIFPEINDGAAVNITAGIHPVLQLALEDGKRFVPNDVVLDDTENQLMVITGPNMAGKSTYIRQVALLVLMAQIGCGIPAEKAIIGIVDRIFTRVGASDDIGRGQSTFMVEMNEAAYILNHATSKSLIVLDEIGRGTSTFDGISIAWAIAEYLVSKKGNNAGPKTLFATHYHELIKLAETYPSVKNYNIAVKEWNDEIIFLYKILHGGTDKSYGIHVARLAGLPYGIIERSKQIMASLEEGSFISKGVQKEVPKQMNLFEVPRDQIIDNLRSIRLEYITPIEALNKLKELKERVEEF